MVQEQGRKRNGNSAYFAKTPAGADRPSASTMIHFTFTIPRHAAGQLFTAPPITHGEDKAGHGDSEQVLASLDKQ